MYLECGVRTSAQKHGALSYLIIGRNPILSRYELFFSSSPPTFSPSVLSTCSATAELIDDCLFSSSPRPACLSRPSSPAAWASEVRSSLHPPSYDLSPRIIN